MLSGLSYADGLIRLNTRLLANCFADVDDERARERPIMIANNMIFLALHVLDARYYLLGVLTGSERSHAFSELLANVNSVDQLTAPPPLEKVLDAWATAESELLDGLQNVDEEKLAEPSPFDLPIQDSSIAGFITFILQHESYHIGQLALLRRGLGLPAMKYA